MTEAINNWFKIAQLEKILKGIADHSRYPEDIDKFEAEYDELRCKKLINSTEKTIKWLKNLLEQK